MTYAFMDGIEVTFIEDGANIKDTVSGETYFVAGAGVHFLKLIDGNRSMDQMLEELIKIFGPNVETYILARDLGDFMMNLASNGIVKMTKDYYGESVE